MSRKVACFESGIAWLLALNLQLGLVFPAYEKWLFTPTGITGLPATLINAVAIVLPAGLAMWSFVSMRETRDDELLMKAKIRQILES